MAGTLHRSARGDACFERGGATVELKAESTLVDRQCAERSNETRRSAALE